MKLNFILLAIVIAFIYVSAFQKKKKFKKDKYQ